MLRQVLIFCQMILVVVSLWLELSADESKSVATNSPEQRAEVKQALEVFNPLVGGWRGVGQPQRSSNKGAWSETAEWVWEIKKDHIGIRYAVTGGKQLTDALLTFDPKNQLYVLEMTLPDKSRRHYQGKFTDGKLLLESPADSDSNVHQILITLLNDKRTLVLFQSRKTTQELFARVAEVGYTREGTRLAVEGADGPECIVTGGKGTSSIVYQGKTYYFCCTGCRDAFNDDPEGIIAEYARKKKK